jgi:hypothetical protein
MCEYHRGLVGYLSLSTPRWRPAWAESTGLEQSLTRSKKHFERVSRERKTTADIPTEIFNA